MLVGPRPSTSQHFYVQLFRISNSGKQRIVYSQELPLLRLKKGLQLLRGDGGKTQGRAEVLRDPGKETEDKE